MRQFRPGAIGMHVHLVRQNAKFGAELCMQLEMPPVVRRPVVNGPHEQPALLEEPLGAIEKRLALLQRRSGIGSLTIDRILPVQMDDDALWPMGPVEGIERISPVDIKFTRQATTRLIFA